MNNKKYIFIILGIIIIAVLASLIIEKSKRVEKFTIIDLIDSFGEQISSYDENKMSFTIERKKDTQKITVNGEEYTEKEMFYKPGNYLIEVRDGKNKEKAVVKINEITRNEENEYSIYVTTETLQTLFANLNMVDNLQKNGFMWTQRNKTVNIDNIKNAMPNIQISQYNGEIEEKDFIGKLLPEIQEYIKKVLQKDNNAYFHLYIEEQRFYLELELFGKIGLDDSRYDVTMYTTGTLGYLRNYEITESDKYTRFIKEKEDYYEIVENIKNNTLIYNEHPGSYLVDKTSKIYATSYNYDYMLISTLRKNIKFALQYPEMIEFKDEKIEQEMKKANIIKIVAQEEYDKLEKEEREAFFKNVSLNKEELDEKYFTNQDKKYLIITGTVPFYGTMKQADFERIINEICEQYQEEFIILYKPHPREIPNKEQEEFLNRLNIKVLPGQIPMEAILFVYPNVKIGGFASSLYMSADKEKTEFFFAKNKKDLVNPLDDLYDLLFKNAKFYN